VPTHGLPAQLQAASTSEKRAVHRGVASGRVGNVCRIHSNAVGQRREAEVLQQRQRVRGRHYKFAPTRERTRTLTPAAVRKPWRLVSNVTQRQHVAVALKAAVPAPRAQAQQPHSGVAVNATDSMSAMVIVRCSPPARSVMVADVSSTAIDSGSSQHKGSSRHGHTAQPMAANGFVAV
jgi:hypothetical protein